MEILKASLAALPLAIVSIWLIFGLLGARLAARPDAQVWSLPSRTFHWVMAFATLGTTALMYYSQIYEANAATDPGARAQYSALLKWHKSIGLAVLFLVPFRFVWNQLRPRPPLPSGMPASQLLAVRLVHGSFYVLMLTIPLLGWFASMAYGGRTHFFGWFEMPVLIGKNVDAAVVYRNGHIWLGWLLYGLLGVHIGAALWHHFARRDATLAQMLPWSQRTGSIRAPLVESGKQHTGVA